MSVVLNLSQNMQSVKESCEIVDESKLNQLTLQFGAHLSIEEIDENIKQFHRDQLGSCIERQDYSCGSAFLGTDVTNIAEKVELFAENLFVKEIPSEFSGDLTRSLINDIKRKVNVFDAQSSYSSSLYKDAKNNEMVYRLKKVRYSIIVKPITFWNFVLFTRYHLDLKSSTRKIILSGEFVKAANEAE